MGLICFWGLHKVAIYILFMYIIVLFLYGIDIKCAKIVGACCYTAALMIWLFSYKVSLSSLEWSWISYFVFLYKRIVKSFWLSLPVFRVAVTLHPVFFTPHALLFISHSLSLDGVHQSHELSQVDGWQRWRDLFITILIIRLLIILNDLIYWGCCYTAPLTWWLSNLYNSSFCGNSIFILFHTYYVLPCLSPLPVAIIFVI